MSNREQGASRSGRVALFGSGETARVGRRVHELLLAAYERPVPVAVIETPAGFQPNVEVLSTKVRAFFEHNLQNFKPNVTVVPARRRGDGPLGTDGPAACDGLREAEYIFAGAGSPTYAVRHLAGTRLWETIVNRLDAGATLALASAMALAAARYTLPVYEIYKVGEDPSWVPGLDLFGADGLELAVVPHWNNREGGAELDTSRCYMGEARFAELRAQLSPSAVVLGIDEHTVCVVDRAAEEARVHGVGGVTIVRGDTVETYADGERFPLSRLRG
ncbi:MAG: cysteinyl-tRNA synthetase [Chloroflexota bacterium]|nr:cysteinyl-tRNA synthetase [Chloroflexota bacterium]